MEKNVPPLHPRTPPPRIARDDSPRASPPYHHGHPQFPRRFAFPSGTQHRRPRPGHHRHQSHRQGDQTRGVLQGRTGPGFFLSESRYPGLHQASLLVARLAMPISPPRASKSSGFPSTRPIARKPSSKNSPCPTPSLADPDGKVVKAFGVPEMGKFAKRQAYLFKDGKVVWRDLAASTDKQADGCPRGHRKLVIRAGPKSRSTEGSRRPLPVRQYT